MEDGEKILGEFGFGAGILLVENHELAAVLLNQPLDEFKSESGEAVPVGNHKREFFSPVKALQYGEQALPSPVEASGDVSDDFGAGIGFPHEGGLAPEVSALLGGADAAVADRNGRGITFEEGFDVVEPLAAGVSVEGDFALTGIAPQSLGM